MRSKFTKAAMLLVVMCAVCGTGGPPASAALPEIVPTPSHREPLTFHVGFGEVIFNTSGQRWSYKVGYIKGEFVGPKELAGVHIEFENPTTGGCTNSGTNKLVLYELKGRLGYINKATKEVGVLLEPPKEGARVADCETFLFGKEHWTGSFIGAITPVNKNAKELNLTYLQKKEGEPLYETFDEGLELGHHLTISRCECSAAFTGSLGGLKNFGYRGKSVEVEIKS